MKPAGFRGNFMSIHNERERLSKGFIIEAPRSNMVSAEKQHQINSF
jgi:hypothetical protein